MFCSSPPTSAHERPEEVRGDEGPGNGPEVDGFYREVHPSTGMETEIVLGREGNFFWGGSAILSTIEMLEW